MTEFRSENETSFAEEETQGPGEGIAGKASGDLGQESPRASRKLGVNAPYVIYQQPFTFLGSQNPLQI